MHLLIVVPAYSPFVGGAQTLCRMLVSRLVADGHRVTILTTNAQQVDDFWQPPPNREALPGDEEIEGARIIRLSLCYPWPAPWRFGIERRASHQFARLPLPAALQRPVLRHVGRSMPPLAGLEPALSSWVAVTDGVLIVDAAWDGLFVAAAQIAFFQSKPVVAMPLIHTGSPAMTGRFRMAHQVAVYRQAAVTIALTPPEQALLAGWGVSQEKLHCLPLGVGPVNTQDARRFLDVVRDRYGLPPQYVLFLGAATYDKGAFTVASAMAVAEIARSGEAVPVVFAGAQQKQLADFLDTMPAQVRAAVQKRTHLVGFVDERTKQALLAGCSLLVLPSQVDSFGIVLLEAWQHGKPVVAADVGGPAAIVTPGETGLLVPFGEPEALADAIKRVLNEPGLAARLGAAGHQVVLNQYTWEQVYNSFCQLLSLARILPFGQDFGHDDERF